MHALPTFDDLLEDFFVRYPAMQTVRDSLVGGYELLRDSLAGGHKVLACGNGGSAADAEHIVGELVKSFAYHRPVPATDRERLQALFGAEGDDLASHLEAPLPALSLASPVALGTAIANDTGYAYGFAQQVYGLGVAGDVLIGISTSGNSDNVVKACQVAKLRGLSVLGLTGARPARMDSLCDVVVKVPAEQTHVIQEYHLPVYHLLCFALETHFFGVHGRRH